jgi:hypothetical protein
MTSRERVLAALRLERPDRVPFVDLGVDHKAARAVLGRDTFTQGEVADALGLDAMGFALYPPIYTVNQVADDGRSYIVGGRVHGRAHMGMVQLPDPAAAGYLDSARRFVDDNASSGRALYAATNMGADPVLLGMGLEHFAYGLADDPGFVSELLGMYADWATRLVRALGGVGFDFVWFTDDLAYGSGPMMSPKVFREVFVPPLRRVAGAVAAVGLPWAFHSDGDLRPILPDLLSLGMNALHPIEPGVMDIRELKREIGGAVCLIGNVDVGELLALGTPEAVREAVRCLVRDVAPGGGYMVSSSNSIASFCRPENVVAMAQAVREFGEYGETEGTQGL